MALEASRTDSGELLPALVLGSAKDLESCIVTDTEFSIASENRTIAADYYNSSNNHFMFRLYVRPFTTFSSNIITPMRYLNHHSIYIPRHVLSPLRVSPVSRFDYNEDYNERHRMKDEWNSIWPQCRIFVSQGSSTRAVKQEKLISMCLFLTYMIILYIGLFSSALMIFFAAINLPGDHLLLLFMFTHSIVTIMIIGGVFSVYSKYGDANLSRINEQRKLLLLQGFALTVVMWIVFLIYIGFTVETSEQVCAAVVLTSSLLYLVMIVVGIFYRRHLVADVADKGRHDEALQNVHDEIKCISNNFNYFVLQPTVRHDKSDIAVDVYFKINDGSELSQLPLPFQNSVSISANAATAKRRGRNVEMV